MSILADVWINFEEDMLKYECFLKIHLDWKVVGNKEIKAATLVEGNYELKINISFKPFIWKVKTFF
jgi:hypothetical protein